MSDSKRCARCGDSRSLSEFYPDKSKSLGVSSWCRPCTLADRRAQYADPEKRAVILARNRLSSGRYVDKARERRRVQRAEMIEAYGGACTCCGERRQEFLTVDHIFNDGAAERASNSMVGSKVYYHLKRLGWPKDRYQLLCFNCNCAKGIHGRCPHENEP